MSSVTITREVQQLKGQELNADIGKKVKSSHPYAFRTGETAEIIGWCYQSYHGTNDRLCYTIRYDDNETDTISADLSLSIGYTFV